MSQSASAFFQLHRDLPREGPGDASSVAWALDRVVLPQNPRICDAGCGPGADLAVFADLLPDATLFGLDGQLHFVDAARGRVPRAEVHCGDMAGIVGPYDLIWCAGAIYFLGVTRGLSLWRTALASGGAIAFSEPVYVPGAPPEAVEFWAQAYPQLTNRAGIAAQVAAAGYDVLAVRRIAGSPWAAYYEPMSARIAALRPDASPELTQVLNAEARDIALWRAAPNHIAYDLFLVRPK